MEIIAKQFVLQAALDKVFGIAAKGGNNPALQHVLAEVDAGEDSVKLTGSDGELTLISVVDQIDIEDGGTVLLSPQFHDIIKSCPDDDVTVKTTTAMIEVECQSTKWQIRQENIEYPDIVVAHEDPVIIPKVIIDEALKKCRPAIMSESLRQVFAFIQIKDGVMRAADGSKLHQTPFPYKIDGLIPAKAVPEIIRRIRGMAMEDVSIAQSEATYTFRFDNDVLSVTKHIVEYPDVDENMLKPAMENDQQLLVEKSRFIDAIKRVALTADPDTSYMTIEMGEDQMVLTTLDKFGNNAKESLDVSWESDPRKLGVNHNYLLDVLSAVPGANVVAKLGADDPPRVSKVLFEDEAFTAVLEQLRADLGDAAKGSDRIRPAQQDPTGWGAKGSTASDEELTTDGGHRARRASKKQETASAVDVEDAEEALAEVLDS